MPSLKRRSYGLPAAPEAELAPFQTGKRINGLAAGIREYCRLCIGPRGVNRCRDDGCPFHVFRQGAPRGTTGRPGAVRRMCLECCADEMAEVRRCTGDRCPIMPWRMGRRLTEFYF